MFRCDQSGDTNSVESIDHSVDCSARVYWRLGSETAFSALAAQCSLLGSRELGKNIRVEFVLQLRREFTPTDFLVFLVTSLQNT